MSLLACGCLAPDPDECADLLRHHGELKRSGPCRCDCHEYDLWEMQEDEWADDDGLYWWEEEEG